MASTAVARKRVSIREVTRSDDPALQQGYRMLGRIFPKTELVRQREWRETLREQEAGLWTDIQWHLVVAEAAGRVVAVATGAYLGNVNTGVIGYLAVSRAARRLGVGPLLRRKLNKLFQRDARRIRRADLKAIVGEVRRDNPWLRTLMRRERVLALDFPYLQPGLRRGDRPVPLVMYYESLDRARKSVSADTIRRLLYTIWRRNYRIARPMADPAFRAMLNALSGRSRIGVIKPPT